jgi:hypothetical protein
MTARPPKPETVAAALRDCASLLDLHAASLTPDGRKLRSSAVQLLAARGWPASTLGDGGSRGTAELTSVESAAARPGHWDDIDARVNAYLRLLFSGAVTLTSLVTDVVAHATADGTARDKHRAGAGACLACGAWCPGTEHERLRSGYCTACYHRWRRSGADRAAFEHATRNQTTATA